LRGKAVQINDRNLRIKVNNQDALLSFIQIASRLSGDSARSDERIVWEVGQI